MLSFETTHLLSKLRDMQPSFAVAIRDAKAQEYEEIGQMMAHVYSGLEGFPKQSEQPEYYKVLFHVGDLAQNPGTRLLVAASPENHILGAVVFIGEMQYYGSGGIAPKERDATGFRLLVVREEARGKGIGRRLTQECIERTRKMNIGQVILHTTKAMITAWRMYESMGFKRSDDLDFMQGELPVFGFRLMLT